MFRMDEDLMQVPVVVLPGTEGDSWYSGWQWSRSLEETFPNQDAWDFSYAVSYHLDQELFRSGIVQLHMVEQGYNDGGNWTWYVRLGDGSELIVTGGCDYTGWDCQSWATAKKVER